MTSSGARQTILDRLRRQGCGDPPGPLNSRWQVSDDPRPLADRFHELAIRNRFELLHPGGSAPLADLPGLLADRVTAGDLRPPLVVAPASRLAALPWPAVLAPVHTPPGADCTLGALEAVAACAETGGVLVSSRRSMALAFVPEVLVLVVDGGRLFRVWEEALTFAGVDGVRSLCMVHGPSRTRDVERIAVFGAHGPRRVLLFVSDRADE